MTASLLAPDTKTTSRGAPWPKIRLSDIGKTITGSTPPKAQKEYYGGDFPFVKPGELVNRVVHDSVDRLSESGAEVADVAPEGSVLVSCIGNLGKTALAGRPVAFNQQINAVVPNDLETGKWIFYAVQSPDFLAQLTAVSSATTISIVNKSKFSALTIPWAPLPEQRRIVAEIEQQFTRLDAGVAALRRTQANLKRYRAAVLKAACEGRLVPNEAELAQMERRKYETGEQLLAHILTERRKNWKGRGKYSEPSAPNKTTLEELPGGWTWAALAQLATYITDGTHKTPTYVDEGVPFLSAKDISGFGISFAKCRYVPESEHEEMSKRCSVRRGNVLITKSGTIGRVAVVETDDEFSLFESVANVPVIAPIEPKFISFAAFVSISGVFGASNQKGVAVRHLHLEDLRRVPIPLPPLVEQTRIVAEVERRLSVVDELESVVNANLQRATRLRQSTLSKAFSAELPIISKS